MINNVTLVGRLTKDPELRYTQSGVANVRFTLAVNRTFKTEGQQDADFINCVAWKKTAENLSNFQKKGSLIGITGRIQTGSYEGQDGKRVFTTDIVAESIQFLERNNQDQQQSTQQQMPQTSAQQYTQQAQVNSQYQSPPKQQYTQNNYQQTQQDDFPF